MSEPKRIQRRRTKGWRMPEGAVYVGRGSQWGNPFKAEAQTPWPRWAGAAPWQVTHPDGRVWYCEPDPRPVIYATRAHAVDAHREAAVRVAVALFAEQVAHDLDVSPLAGRDLACWCPLDQPCHGDVLLEIANTPRPPSSPSAPVRGE